MTRDRDRAFETTLSIAQPPELVWRALTEDRELRRWFAPDATVEPRVGGEVVWAWGETHRWPQRIDIWEPGRRLRTTYDAGTADPDGTPRPLFMDFTLEGQGGSTTLRLVHSGFGPEADFDAEFDGISRGWPVELRSLRLYLERHHGQDRHVAWSVATIDQDADAAWAALIGPRGFSCASDVTALAEGDRFAFDPARGPRFEGRALVAAGREFSGVAESHGDAFLRISVERCGGPLTAWLWLACYGDGAEERAARTRADFDAILADVFGQDAVLEDPAKVRLA